MAKLEKVTLAFVSTARPTILLIYCDPGVARPLVSLPLIKNVYSVPTTRISMVKFVDIASEGESVPVTSVLRTLPCVS